MRWFSMIVGLVIWQVSPSSAQSLPQSSAFLGHWTASRSLPCDRTNDSLIVIEAGTYSPHESECSFENLTAYENRFTADLACWTEGEKTKAPIAARLIEPDTALFGKYYAELSPNDRYHRCVPSEVQLVQSQISGPRQDADVTSSNGYLESFRASGRAALSEGSDIVQNGGFPAEFLEADIVMSVMPSNVDPIKWLTVAEWFALIERNGDLENWQALAGEEGSGVYGIKVRRQNVRSFDVVFELDFGEAFLAEVDGMNGQESLARVVMLNLAGFDLGAYIADLP